MALPEKFQSWWDDQPGPKKRMYLILAVVCSLMLASTIFKKQPSKKITDPRQTEQQAVDNMTVVAAPRRVETREDEKAQVRALQQKFDATVRERTEVQQKLDQQQLENKKFAEESLKNQGTEFSKQIAMLQDEIKVLRSGVNNPVNDAGLPSLNMDGGAAPGLPKKSTGKIDPPLPAVGAQSSASAEVAVAAEPAKPKLRVIGADLIAKSGSADAPEAATTTSDGKEVPAMQTSASPANKKTTDHFLPAGSIIEGVLINGMDAPTDATAQKQPVPALVRIKEEAILPNKYRSDVRECFILISGFGSLSDERAKFRTETLSCVRKDGGVIETKIDAYVVSSYDGKVGLRGRLVTKQGAVLARSLLAGFASGFSSSLAPQQVSSLATGMPGSTVPYQDPDIGAAAQRGAYTGVGKALDNLSQYYLDTAKQLHPVLEIDAGQKISIILIRGTMLSLGGAPSSRERQ